MADFQRKKAKSKIINPWTNGGQSMDNETRF